MKQLNRLDIREIRNSTVIFNDGTFAAVLLLKFPDFTKMDRKDYIKAVAGFHVWLNSINFPVQISAITLNSSLSDRLEIFKANIEMELRKRKNKKERDFADSLLEFNRFYKWFSSYANNKKSDSADREKDEKKEGDLGKKKEVKKRENKEEKTEKKIEGRIYYLVIPYSPIFSSKKESKKMKRINDYLAKLNERVESSVRLLKLAKIKAVRMTDEQMINLYSSFYAFSFYNKSGSYDTVESCIEKWKEVVDNET